MIASANDSRIDDLFATDPSNYADMETVFLMTRFLHEGRQDKHDALKVFMDRVSGFGGDAGSIVFVTPYPPIEPYFGHA